MDGVLFAHLGPLPTILNYGGEGMFLDSLTPENIVYLGAVASVQFAKGRNADDIELLAAFFEVVGDNLALLALSAPSAGDE